MSLTDAAASGDQRAMLEALRDHLAACIVAAEVKETAPLAKQLADVVQRIAQLPAEKKGSTVDALAAKRAERLRAAAGS